MGTISSDIGSVYINPSAILDGLICVFSSSPFMHSTVQFMYVFSFSDISFLLPSFNKVIFSLHKYEALVK